jgi:hypothetical protein
VNRRAKIIISAGLAASMLFLTGCAEIAAPDAIGLYYMEGQSDGYEFGECIMPGKTGDAVWNNSVVYLPVSKRDWLIDDVEGADDKEPLIVSAAPQENQPSGVQVRLSVQANFMLNTFCDADGGIVRDFWEKIGRRYGADTSDGRDEMLRKVFSPTLKAIAKNEVRKFNADDLIANKDNIQEAVLKAIAAEFSTEVNRLAGGPFFCGPDFNPASSDCSQIQLQMISMEYGDPGIQAARNEKQKAIELAAAKLATAEGEAKAMIAKAQGEAEAARALNTLYNTDGWVKIQQQIEAGRALIEACKAAKECRLIVGTDGSLIMAS